MKNKEWKDMNEEEREIVAKEAYKLRDLFLKYYLTNKISDYNDRIELLKQKIEFSREILTEILNEIERK